jgi:hypothetical protein
LAASAWQKIFVFTRALLFSNGRSLQTQKSVLLYASIRRLDLDLIKIAFKQAVFA